MNRPSSLGRAFATTVSAFALSLMLVLPAQAMQSNQTDPATPDAAATPAVDTGPRFLIHPSDGVDGDYFTLEAEPGTTNELVVVIGNADDEMLSLRTYLNDAIPITNGGFAVAAEDVEPTGTATWTDYQAETFNFESGEGVERTFTVTIPEDAEPGQYIAGIALQTAEPLEVEGTDLFNQVIRKTIAVFITVPGEEMPAFALGEPELMTSGALDHIDVPVENTGNVLVRPAGELTIQNVAGEEVLTAPVAMGSVYARTIAPLSVPLVVPLPEGEYTISAELTDEETGTTASIEEAPIIVTGEEEATAQFGATADVSLSPDANNPAFADVNVDITNAGQPVAASEVLLDVMRDGELVETFPLAPSLTLPQGETTVSQRYIPPTGWEAGSWSFVLRLNVVDASTGATTNVVTLDTIPAIDVGE